MVSHKKVPNKKDRKPIFYQKKSFWFFLILLFMTLALAGFVSLDHYTREYRYRAENYDLAKINELEVPSLILDRNGKEIGRIFVQNRSVIPIEEVPELFIRALRAGEDSRFLSHSGVDYIGILRALILNAMAGRSTQGASTITQQLARNAYPLKQDAILKGETSMQRKFVEAFLAMRIEERYSKRQILEFYLNRIYLGSGFYGLRSASLGYFGKEPKDLNLEECTTIVGLIKNPTNNSPLNNIQSSRKSRNMVLKRMADEKMISNKQYVESMLKPLHVLPKPLKRGTSHLYERIGDQVAKSLGEDALAAGGFKIYTTILSEAQNAGEAALEASLQKAESHPEYAHVKYADRTRNRDDTKYLQGAVFMMDHETGDVLAHIGGRNYEEVPFDFIEKGKRPLGTAFFPFVYAVGLAGGLNPGSILEDEPMDNRSVMVGGSEGILGEWGMEIASPKYEGKVTLRNALANSKISASVRLGNQIGIDNVLSAAKIFGFSMENSEALPRVNLGWEPVSLKESVTAISTFALKGRSGPNQFSYIDRIENRDKKIIYRRNKTARKSKKLLNEEVSWQVHNILSGGMVDGSARGLMSTMLEKPFLGAGKGGTTHNFEDTWFLGYNGKVACGVWTGFLNQPGASIYPGAFSRDLAMEVWRATMNAAAPVFHGGEIPKPENIVSMEICKLSGQKVTQFCQELVEDVNTNQVVSRSTAVLEHFIKGTEPSVYCSLHSGTDSMDFTLNSQNLDFEVINSLPILPKSPVLLGEDPYYSDLPHYTVNEGDIGILPRRRSSMDGLDLEIFEEKIPLLRPDRLTITVDELE